MPSTRGTAYLRSCPGRTHRLTTARRPRCSASPGSLEPRPEGAANMTMSLSVISLFYLFKLLYFVDILSVLVSVVVSLVVVVIAFV